MEPGTILVKEQSPTTEEEIEDMKEVPYLEGLGSLMYVCQGTRFDISLPVSLCSRFMHNPGRVHWEAVKQNFRYLKGTRDLQLYLGGVKAPLHGYSDADHASQKDRHSISGYAFMIGGCVSASSKRQPIIALSSTEAEYIAMTHAAKEALWMRALIGELNEPFNSATPLYCDNRSMR
jgi:hypothetical protein